ncbi:MAG: hypothetical protein U0133_10730 [Gemmatimonadales bacterium]
MHSRFRTKGVLLAALLALVASMALPHSASAEPEPGVRKKGFRLFARALGAMTINRVYCGMATTGEICVDSTNSSTIGGGFWPKGTPDQYIFNSGLQVAGIVGPDGGTWAGDTVGGFFFDPKGTTQHGEEVEPIYNASNSADLAIWPEAACVPYNPTNPSDEAPQLFNTLLQTDPSNTSTSYSYPCRKSASQGDVWFMSWEGNPALRAGRKHPLGVVVETRGMGWNFPSGNEDILYYIYTFYNVTSLNAADYANARPSMRPILLQKAQDFHAAVAATGVTLPASGYTFTNLFAAFARDDDVGSAGANYSSVNLPFALGYTYDHGFSPALPGWKFDASIFSAPFFPGVGFTGAKYLKSPTGPGAIQLFSNTINGSPFAGAVNDPRDVVQLYRYLSGTLSTAAGDQSCNTGIQSQTNICFINNTSSQDMRFFQSSTPLNLAPGASGSIVVAYIFAAPVRVAGSVNNTDVKPGDPRRLSSVPLLAGGANLVDSMTGYRGFNDANADNIPQQSEFSVVPKSLLGKAKTAQDVFDNKFLLPFAPDAPQFFLIPGDNQVTVLWRPSNSEDTGDPFSDIANAPTVGASANSLYDPNYRKFDVEGYRIYRGRVDAPNELALIAQFDYAGTVIRDFTGIVNPTAGCAPELSPTLATLAACGVALSPNNKNGTALTAHRDFDLVGDVVQLNAGAGRVLLASGTSQILKADTVGGGGTAGNCGPRTACPALANTGVPFSFIDQGVRNNFRYFYAVTAFDVNSIESGPTSLESPRATRSVRPIKPAGNYEGGSTLVSALVGRGKRVDTLFSTPSIDAATGKFSGPFPATNGATLGFVGELASKVVGAPGALSLTLDSIGAGSAYDGTATRYFVTLSSPGTTVKLTLPLVQDQFNSNVSQALLFDAIKADQSLANKYGGDSTFSILAQASVTLPGNYYTNSYGRGCVNAAPGFTTSKCYYNGSRWFAGPSPAQNETKANPNGGNGVNNTPPLMDTTAANNAGFNNAGELPGVDVIHSPQGYETRQNTWRVVEGAIGSFKRAADYNVYWSATTPGLVDSVIDVTHNLAIPFDSLRMNASYGILTAGTASPIGGSFDARAQLTPSDFGCVAPLKTSAAVQGVIPCTGATQYTLTRQAALSPVIFAVNNSNNDRTAQKGGTGFLMYMPGGIYEFQMAALPSNTVWALRDYVGGISGGTGFGGNLGPFTFLEATRPFSAVGLQVNVSFDVKNNVLAPTFADLKRVHTVPDPYYITSSFEQSTDTKVIKFVNLPERAIIRIYSSSGVLVNLLEHPGPNCQNVNIGTGVRLDPFGGECTWNVRNRNNQVVASGVYFYHIEANSGGGTARRVGRMTIVNFAQ